MAQGVARTKEEKEKLVTKLKPYLQRGLTVPEACRETKIPTSTVYDIMKNDDDLRNEIEAAENYTAVVAETLIHDAIMFEKKKPEKKRNLGLAMWYLERRKKNKYSLKQIHGGDLNVTVTKKVIPNKNSDIDPSELDDIIPEEDNDE